MARAYQSTASPVTKSVLLQTLPEAKGTLLLTPVWKEKSIVESTSSQSDYETHWLYIAGFPQKMAKAIRAVFKQNASVKLCVLNAKGEDLPHQYETAACDLFQSVKGVIEGKPQGKVLMQLVTPDVGRGVIFQRPIRALKNRATRKSASDHPIDRCTL